MTPTTDYTVAFAAGASACVYIYRQVFTMLKEQKNGNGKHARTFAEDPERYWESMRDNVTKPLAQILDRQTKILEEQVKGNNDVMIKLVLLEERSKRQ